eukprot:1381843-Prorocentrum_lima.AAC.1
MTSSLVGSEMCIRDSNVNRHITEIYMADFMLEIVQLLRPSSSTFSKAACLLYTSDAADDM